MDNSLARGSTVCSNAPKLCAIQSACRRFDNFVAILVPSQGTIRWRQLKLAQLQAFRIA